MMTSIDAILRHDEAFKAGVIFDVGANVGETVDEFRAAFPEARIFAFEPAESSFRMLAERHGGDARTQVLQLALDISAGQAAFSDAKKSKGNALIALGLASRNAKMVTVVTGDGFCREHGIARIDLLKIDTEGYDLRVVMGFTEMLRARAIRYLQVECTTTLDNRFHVHLERFIHALHPFGYRLFALTEPVRHCWATDQPLNGIWYANAIFVPEVPGARLRTDGFN